MLPAAPGSDDWSCCPDNWSVWRKAQTWVWAVLLLVQLSMVAFIVVHGRKDKSFLQAFYAFFVAVTLVDCALILLRQPRGWFGTLFGTMYDDSHIDQEDPETHETIHFLTIRTAINKIAEHAVVPALGHAQQLFLTAIAVNRFTAFALPLKHASMWRMKTVLVVSGTIVTTSALLGAAYPFATAIHQAVKCPRLSSKQRAELHCEWVGSWISNYAVIPTALLTLTSAICCSVSFVLNLGSVAMLVLLRTTGRLQRKGPELQLFAHSLWMFVLQLSLAFQDIIYFTDHPGFISANLEIWDWGLKLKDADFRHSSEWLAGVKPRSNWDGVWLEESSGCALFTGYPSEELPLCPTWYLLLTGELRLGGDSDFSVRTLELCLIALSGSLFLLVISGNVRNAYFDFYFKWRCLEKKWKTKRNVKLFKRTGRRAPTSADMTPATMLTTSRH